MTSPDELLAPAIDFRLLDGEVLSRAYAETFEIPPRSLRSTLQPDDLAKLLFEIVGGAEDGYAAERMWVRVAPDGSYEWTLPSGRTVVTDPVTPRPRP